MDNLMQLAMDMILCLLIAAVIGAIIGYLLGKMSKCDQDNETELPATLNSYEESDAVRKTAAKGVSQTISATPSHPISIDLSDAEKDDLSKVSHDVEESQAEMQAFKKNFDGIQGERPPYLPAPRNGIPDDLKEISGIGLKIEDKLNELGIYHFDQIANWNEENVRWIEEYLVFKGRVERENWIGQAKILAASANNLRKS